MRCCSKGNMIISPNLSPWLGLLLLDAGSKELDPELPGHCLEEGEWLAMGRAGCDQLDRARDQQRSTQSYLSIIRVLTTLSPLLSCLLSLHSSIQGRLRSSFVVCFSLNVSLLLAVLCQSEKWQKSILVYDTLTGAGWKS